MMKRSVTDFSEEKKHLKGTPSSHQILFPTEPLKNSITPSRKLFPKGRDGWGGRKEGRGAAQWNFCSSKASFLWGFNMELF